MSRRFSFKIEGAAVNHESVSFRLLASILNGVQQTFYYIGLAETKKEVRTAGRMPSDIIQACDLRRVIEKPGSYEVIAEIGQPLETSMFDAADIGSIVMNKYLGLIESLDGPNEEMAEELFPDNAHRRQILRSIEKYCPKEGDEYEICFAGDDNKIIYGKLRKDSRQKISRIMKYPKVETWTVTGELIRLHLDEHKLAILYPPTSRPLECFYDPEIEDFIIGNLKGIIHVTGRVQLDHNNQPDKIIDVREIAELDLNPVKLSSAKSEDITLQFIKPFNLQPVFNDQTVVLEVPEFNIIAEGVTREEAIRNLEEDFIWLWREYVNVSDELLTGDARDLKQILIGMAMEVKG